MTQTRPIANTIDAVANKYAIALKTFPVPLDANDYSLEVVEKLSAAGIRAEPDLRNEKINYKVREHSVSKVPVILAIGMKEVEDKTVSMRRLGSKQSDVLSVDDVVLSLLIEAKAPDQQ